MIADEEHLAKIGRALADIAHLLEHEDALEERLERVLLLTRDIVPYRRCSLLHRGADGERTLTTVPRTAAVEEPELMARLDRVARLLADGEEVARSRDEAPHLTLPVSGLDDVLGVVRVEPLPGLSYDATHVRLLSVVSAQLGAYLSMIRLREEEARRTKELQAANDFQQLLVGIVSHDLRNPLTTITMAASVLLSRTEDPAQAKMLERALRNAKLASRIINDLVDVTRARVRNALPIEKHRVDLKVVAQTVIADVRLAHPGRAVELCYEGEERSGDWDADRLVQIVTNLLNNALIHGDEREPVRLHVALTSHEAVLSVHNEGPPIPAELLPNLFDPFRQGRRSAPKSKAGGLGLGLYIVDQAVRAHGGSVSVTSRAPEGTTFEVKLPRWEGERPVSRRRPPSKATEDARPPPQEQDAGEHPLIMVVDDDQDVREALRDLLDGQGCSVATAANGEEALEALRRGIRPKLILLDVSMPVMDGEAFQSAVHSDPTLCAIALVIISADAANALRLQRRGALAFLQKPVPQDELLRVIAHWAH